MGKRQRYWMNRAANWLEDAAEWLRAKAERKPRVRPLCFPTEFELFMDRMTHDMLRRHAQDILFSGPKNWGIDHFVRVSDEPWEPNRIVKIKLPDDYVSPK